MRYSLSTAVALLAAGASCIPSGPMQKRDTGFSFTVYHINDSGVTDRNETLQVMKLDSCMDLGNGWENSITRIDVGSDLFCTYYMSKNCTDLATGFTGGNDTLTQANMKNNIKSYDCKQNAGTSVMPSPILPRQTAPPSAGISVEPSPIARR